MNKTQFVELVKHPDQASEQTLSELKEIIEEYPFFQVGRMLLLKNLHNLDNIRYNSELKHSAVYIPDRNQLFALINNLYPKHEESNLNLSEKVELKEETATEKEPIIEDSDKNPDEKTEPVVTVTDNYLNADDEFTTDDGNIYNFSAQTKKEEDDSSNEELQNIVLPAADLLDYEISTTSGYALPQLEEIENPNINESKSFSDWLHVMRYSAPIKRQEKEEEKPKGMNLIDNFLNSKPKITPNPANKTKDIDLSEFKNDDSEEILSETLADIFIKQGHKTKAISILEKLLLKYPEKNAYFARRISNLKEN